jgi:AraC-like DNA-binding protein
MQAELLKVMPVYSHSFTVREDVGQRTNKAWHYHPEVEFIQIIYGEGYHYIGDSAKRFQTGDIFILGARLPHYFKFDEIYLDGKSADPSHVSVIQFSENFWGGDFLALPENTHIKNFLERAKRGYLVPKDSNNTISAMLKNLREGSGAERIIILLHVLHLLSGNRSIKQLSSVVFSQNIIDPENNRLNAVYEYSFANYKRKIELQEIADIANISPNSFCRYFKRKTKKTYSQFITEIRVGHACKLLIEGGYFIKQVCYECGFNNFATFNKYFKAVTGKSPLLYQKEFIKTYYT